MFPKTANIHFLKFAISVQKSRSAHPLASTILISKKGRPVHTWISPRRSGSSSRMQETVTSGLFRFTLRVVLLRHIFHPSSFLSKKSSCAWVNPMTEFIQSSQRNSVTPLPVTRSTVTFFYGHWYDNEDEVKAFKEACVTNCPPFFWNVVQVVDDSPREKSYEVSDSWYPPHIGQWNQSCTAGICRSDDSFQFFHPFRYAIYPRAVTNASHHFKLQQK